MFFRASPGTACFVAPACVLVAIAVVRKRYALLFWLPLVATLSALCVLSVPLPRPRRFTLIALIGVGWVVATACIALRRSVLRYRATSNRDFMLLTALLYGAVGGLLTSAMIALPLLIRSYCFDFVVQPVVSVESLVAPLLIGAVAGMFICLPLGVLTYR